MERLNHLGDGRRPLCGVQPKGIWTTPGTNYRLIWMKTCEKCEFERDRIEAEQASKKAKAVRAAGERELKPYEVPPRV